VLFNGGDQKRQKMYSTNRVDIIIRTMNSGSIFSQSLSDDVCMILPGGGCRLQPCRVLAAQWFDSTLRTRNHFLKIKFSSHPKINGVPSIPLPS